MTVKRFKPEMFEKLARTNVNWVNVSLDSLTPATFEKLCVNSRFETFQYNVEQLTTVFRNNPSAPRIRYISMALRSNYKELIGMIEASYELYNASQHEVRLPFEAPHAPPGWEQEEGLTALEWSRLEDEIARLPYSTKMMPTGGTARYYGPEWKI